jgi:phospholipid/cholesterol/gamma-HCH transport system permease protein
MKPLSVVGGYVLERARNLRYLTSILVLVLWSAAQPRCWARPARAALARQIFSHGVESAPFIGGVAVLLGAVVVLLSRRWAEGVLSPDLMNPLLIMVVARELGPLLTNIALIARNGSSSVVELGLWRMGGGIRAMESKGVDPFVSVLMPRVLGAVISAFCLVATFIGMSFATAFLFGISINHLDASLERFLDELLVALGPADLIVIVVTTCVPAFCFAAICAAQGLAIEREADIPLALQRAMTRSLALLFLVSAAVSFGI